MKREMHQITVEALDIGGNVIKITQEDAMADGGEHAIYISPEQIELLCQWLMEVSVELET